MKILVDANVALFEDAVQYASGEAISVDFIVTRNTTDFASALLPVVTPNELLNILTGS